MTDPKFEALIKEIEAGEEKPTEEKPKQTVDPLLTGDVKPTLDEDGEIETEEEFDIEYAHEQIMEDEGLSKGDLPEEVQSMIAIFENKKEQADSADFNEKRYLRLQNLSTLIGDKILDEIDTYDFERINVGPGGELNVEKKKKSMFGDILGGIFDY